MGHCALIVIGDSLESGVKLHDLSESAIFCKVLRCARAEISEILVPCKLIWVREVMDSICGSSFRDLNSLKSSEINPVKCCSPSTEVIFYRLFVLQF